MKESKETWTPNFTFLVVVLWPKLIFKTGHLVKTFGQWTTFLKIFERACGFFEKFCDFWPKLLAIWPLLKPMFGQIFREKT